jgi:hypothetical protein
VRDDTSDCAEIRWEILKSMLDNFPQLLDRTEKYIIERRNLIRTNSASQSYLDVKKLMQNTVKEYHEERRKK